MLLLRHGAKLPPLSAEPRASFTPACLLYRMAWFVSLSPDNRMPPALFRRLTLCVDPDLEGRAVIVKTQLLVIQNISSHINPACYGLRLTSKGFVPPEGFEPLTP